MKERNYTFKEFVEYKGYDMAEFILSIIVSIYFSGLFIIFPIVFYIQGNIVDPFTIQIGFMIGFVVTIFYTITYRLYIDWKSDPYKKELNKLKKDIEDCNKEINKMIV